MQVKSKANNAKTNLLPPHKGKTPASSAKGDVVNLHQRRNIDAVTRDEAISLYRLRSFIYWNTPDTLNFAFNEVNGEPNKGRRARFSGLLDQAKSGDEQREQALKQLEAQIAGLGVPYEALFKTDDYR